jgi:hypothetical protein
LPLANFRFLATASHIASSARRSRAGVPARPKSNLSYAVLAPPDVIGPILVGFVLPVAGASLPVPARALGPRRRYLR